MTEFAACGCVKMEKVLDIGTPRGEIEIERLQDTSGIGVTILRNRK